RPVWSHPPPGSAGTMIETSEKAAFSSPPVFWLSPPVCAEHPVKASAATAAIAMSAVRGLFMCCFFMRSSLSVRDAGNRMSRHGTASAFEIIGRGFVSIGRGCLSRPVPRARVRGENDPVASMMKRASHRTQDGRMTLRVQLILLQALIVATVTLIAGVTAGVIQAHTVRDAYEDRMLAVAQSIASMPVIRSAFA